MEKDKIRVMVVDDHVVVRLGLKHSLLTQDDMELVAEAGSGEEALRLCDRLQPDVVLMDVVMPGMGGIAATRAIRQRYPRVQVVILTSFQQKELVQQAIRAGAIGFLVKTVSIDELAGAIRAAVAGRPILCGEVIRVLMEQSSELSQPQENLTARQQEVLALVAAGRSNNEIADRLIISPATVRHHVSEILARLGAANRAEAAALAMRDGLVESLAAPTRMTGF